MWRLLSRYNFEIDSNSIIDLTCVICHKIVKDCRQSLCGCRYCCGCIEKYLDGQDRICPGSNVECKEQYIDFSIDIQIDYVANMKVSRIVVKCPESDCQHRDELRYIEDHISSHNINCPYFEVGCDKDGLNITNIYDHLKDDGFSHSTLLMNFLQQSRHELNFLSEDSQKRTKEIDNLNIINIDLNKLIEKLNENNSNLNNDVNILKEKEEFINQLAQEANARNFELSNKLEKFETDILSLKNEMKMLKKTNQEKDEFIKNLSQQFVSKNEEIQKNFDKWNIEMSTLKFDLEILKKSNQDKDQTLKALSQLVETNEKQMSSNVQELKDFVDKIKNPMNSPQQMDAPYRWNIENFSIKQKIAEESFDHFILSEPFYSTENGYKLCLVVWPNGSQASNYKWLAVGFHLMIGKNDEHLEWPMKCTVTISLIKQDNNTIHSSVQFDYHSTDKNYRGCFHRPTISMNKPRENTRFINIDTLLKNKKLYRNDSIIFNCSVEETDYSL